MIKPIFLPIHIAAGIAAILLGTVAIAVRKGGRRHVQAGIWFAVAMIVLGVTASILEPFRTPKPGSPITGLFVLYFVATSWVAARRKDGTTGKFEMLAAAVALGTGAVMVWAGLTGRSSTPVGSGPVFILAGLSLVAGLLDLRVALRKRLTAGERIRRHLWRMCFAFFIATGSFFLGQQKVMPVAVRDSPLLFLLAFAPLAVMVFWLVRLRFAKFIGRLSLRLPPQRPSAAPIPRLEMET
jgi:uncharacterized membrane protein